MYGGGDLCVILINKSPCSSEIIFYSIPGSKNLDLCSSVFDPVLADYYHYKAMSRRPNTSRRLGDSGSIPFMGALHPKSRPSPLLSVGLVVVVSLRLFHSKLPKTCMSMDYTCPFITYIHLLLMFRGVHSLVTEIKDIHILDIHMNT